jgi:thiol-disulfide isomerase/thioredoxin
MRFLKSPLFIVGILGLFGLWHFGKAFLGPKSGPDFSKLATLEGEPVSREATEGKWMLVSYVQSWCGDCIREMPSIERLQKQVGTENLAVLLISDEDSNHIRRIMRRTNLQVYRSETGLKRMGVFVYPTTLLLDPKGNLRVKKEEGFDWDAPEILQLF